MVPHIVVPALITFLGIIDKKFKICKQYFGISKNAQYHVDTFDY